MLTEHRIRITSPEPVSPETAAVRLVAQFPPTWRLLRVDCSTDSAAADLIVEIADEMPQHQVERIVDVFLTAPGLTGWIRAGR